MGCSYFAFCLTIYCDSTYCQFPLQLNDKPLSPPPPPTIQMKVECRSSFQGTEVILLQFKVFCSKKKIFTSEPPPQEVPPSLSPVKDFTSALSRKRKYNKYVLQSLCAPLVIWIHFFFFSPPPRTDCKLGLWEPGLSAPQIGSISQQTGDCLICWRH